MDNETNLNGRWEGAVESALEQRRADIDEFLTSSFDSILRIEEKSLNNRLIQGLTIKEIHTIVAIGYDEEHPMSVVASRLNVTMATLNVSVSRLVEKGFVKRRRDDADKRKILLSLTKEGRKVFRVHKMFHAQMVDAALDGLTDDEIEVLARSLSQMAAFFERQLQE